ncbi:hypothetical protein [Piscinibacterium candidicorallinum]|uniref:PcfJ-like protein n=1 Tax=Piscinibacterium candidicorallinum TaxID=1793872 RepID=A0ABV7H018_9BURK
MNAALHFTEPKQTQLMLLDHFGECTLWFDESCDQLQVRYRGDWYQLTGVWYCQREAAAEHTPIQGAEDLYEVERWDSVRRRWIPTRRTVREWLNRIYHRPAVRLTEQWLRHPPEIEFQREQSAPLHVIGQPPVELWSCVLIHRRGPNRATPTHWRSFLGGLSHHGVGDEELALLELDRLFAAQPDAAILKSALIGWIDNRRFVPRLVHETEMRYLVRSGWKDVDSDAWARRRLRPSGTIVPVSRHRGLGWWVAEALSPPMFDLPRAWYVFDNRLELQRRNGFERQAAAEGWAEKQMEARYADWAKQTPEVRWRRYTTPSGRQYEEILVQLDDWSESFYIPHFTARNVVLHLRTCIRRLPGGRRTLFIEELQSDEHQRRTSVAPYGREWPLLGLKLAVWLAQQRGLDAVTIASLAYRTYCGRYLNMGLRFPRDRYEKEFPKAMQRLAKVLHVPVTQEPVYFDLHGSAAAPWVRPSPIGMAGGPDDSEDELPFDDVVPQPESLSFWSALPQVPPSEGAEYGVDGRRIWMFRMQTLDLRGIRAIKRVPAYGVADSEFWFGSPHQKASTGH